MSLDNYSPESKIRYELTGRVAHSRIAPLLPAEWIDASSNSTTTESNCENNNTDSPQPAVDVLWENAPRHATKSYRDNVKVYSHLPNGGDILDSKWVLGRLFSQTIGDEEDPQLAGLETHCFRGIDGFQNFCGSVGMEETPKQQCEQDEIPVQQFPDILHDNISYAPSKFPKAPSNLWVVKDATSNGAGAIWVVGPENFERYASPDSTPLYEGHRYVAQRYVWPPVLYGGRKCHVRVYGLLTSDGRAMVHKRAFLHVANDGFGYLQEGGRFQDSVHITNCCANSHDDDKFSGEILADFEQEEFGELQGQQVVPLAKFFPSIRACVASMARRFLPFLQGGAANNGFEYLGMDFILSYSTCGEQNPVAYLLEINAPPSQDTATGLAHAEDLHNTVFRDLMSLWVLPKVTGVPEIPGGWRCVFQDPSYKVQPGDHDLIVPSKASILNKIRWTLFERKMMRLQSTSAETAAAAGEKESVKEIKGTVGPMLISNFARTQFPYFSAAIHHPLQQVFFENAGGSQVAKQVIAAVGASLLYRHRSKVGSKIKAAARETLSHILGATNDHSIVLGSNATSLLYNLANAYTRRGLLTKTDEIVISAENHLANVEPWVQAAREVGAKIKWWNPFCETESSDASPNLAHLLSPKTRIVALSHASNILGQIRDIAGLRDIIKSKSKGRAHVIVDGVAASPHWFPSVSELGVDWYVVSCHKNFGPHLGGLCGGRAVVEELLQSSVETTPNGVSGIFELGTISYEALAGVVGMGEYLRALAIFEVGPHYNEDMESPIVIQQSSHQSAQSFHDRSEPTAEPCYPMRLQLNAQQRTVTSDHIQEAYRRIRIAEAPLVHALLGGLGRSSKVRFIEGRNSDNLKCLARLPVVAFVHHNIPSPEIISACEQNGIICRLSSFLCTSPLAKEFGFDPVEGILRVSLVHYNTVREIQFLIGQLESLPGWF
jgi:selenocysteine lyase/cysteine desulfurase